MKKIELDSPYISRHAASYVNHVMDGFSEGKTLNTPAAFEKKVSEYLEVNYACACNSGTNALHIALLALNIGEGGEVITNPLTNIGTISAILKCGCVPVFPMINREGFFDIQDMKKKITKKTKAVIPVHFSGYSEDMKGLSKIAKEHGLLMVEDACQAFGSMINIDGAWKYLGAVGDIGVYSLGGGKTLSAIEGGMIVTNEPSIADRANKLIGTGDYSENGMVLGFNSRLDALRSAVGLANLKDLSQNIEARKKIWSKYQESLSKYSWVRITPVKDDLRINYSSFSMKIASKKDREMLLSLFKGINYHVSTTRQKGQPNAYIGSSSLDKKMSEAIDHIYESNVALPVHGHIDNKDVENILGCFRKLDKLRKN